MDPLGSTRETVAGSNAPAGCHDYLPFGEELNGIGGRTGSCWGAGETTLRFTGKERDAETTSSAMATGLDYFGARYLSSAQGRFTSPDPLMASAHPENPQTWNRYTYGLNNPLRNIDVDGLYPSPSYNCTEGGGTCLNDDQRRILENSKINRQSGEALWNSIGATKDAKGMAIGESLQNSFVNQTDGLSAIKFSDGKSAISFVSSLSDVKQDRIFANVGTGLADELSRDARFGTASAGMHAGGGFSALSFKSTDYPQGNIQFSFNESHAGVDIDHDLYAPGLAHLFGEVLVNHATGGLTNQDSVRQMLMKNPKIGLTPSPDPKWNRR